MRRSWWSVVLAGAAAFIAGLFFIFFPVKALTTLVLIFGIFAFAAGAAAIIGGLVSLTKKQGGVSMLVEGALAIAAGIIVFSWPQITALIFLYVIGAWAIVVGLVEMVGAFQRKRTTSETWLLAAAGAFTLVFGIALFIVPTASGIAISWLLGVYLVARGTVQAALGLALRTSPLAARLPLKT
jgi:uncharacterized membrane protein HdeD (DUF308 family)